MWRKTIAKCAAVRFYNNNCFWHILLIRMFIRDRHSFENRFLHKKQLTEPSIPFLEVVLNLMFDFYAIFRKWSPQHTKGFDQKFNWLNNTLRFCFVLFIPMDFFPWIYLSTAKIETHHAMSDFNWILTNWSCLSYRLSHVMHLFYQVRHLFILKIVVITYLRSTIDPTIHVV